LELFGLITTFGAWDAPGFWWSLLSSPLALAVGILVIVLPASGAISVTLLLTIFFIPDGIASIMYALDHQTATHASMGMAARQRLV
jgi:uncharacterized membrane protein HdeD (DUF308 family)